MKRPKTLPCGYTSENTDFTLDKKLLPHRYCFWFSIYILVGVRLDHEHHNMKAFVIADCGLKSQKLW